MGNCVMVVQLDLPKRTEQQAIKGGTHSPTIDRNLAAKGLIRRVTSTAKTAPVARPLERPSVRRSLVHRRTGQEIGRAIWCQAPAHLV